MAIFFLSIFLFVAILRALRTLICPNHETDT
jgi:hypothetical protein